MIDRWLMLDGTYKDTSFLYVGPLFYFVARYQSRHAENDCYSDISAPWLSSRFLSHPQLFPFTSFSCCKHKSSPIIPLSPHLLTWQMGIHCLEHTLLDCTCACLHLSLLLYLYLYILIRLTPIIIAENKAAKA